MRVRKGLSRHSKDFCFILLFVVRVNLRALGCKCLEHLWLVSENFQEGIFLFDFTYTCHAFIFRPFSDKSVEIFDMIFEIFNPLVLVDFLLLYLSNIVFQRLDLLLLEDNAIVHSFIVSVRCIAVWTLYYSKLAIVQIVDF